MKLLDILTSPWAIEQSKLNEIVGIYLTHLRGEKIDIKSLEDRLGEPLERKDQGYSIENGVGIITIDGVIAQKANMFTKISGGCSLQMLERDFRMAMEDPEVERILLYIDSPGGSTAALETSDMIRSMRGRKPIIAFTDGQMCSAAVAIGTAADRVYISGESTCVGSIGVVCAHTDQSEYDRKMGIKVTEITSGRYKRIASSHEPLREEGREYIQSQCDYLYSAFISLVSENRGVDIEKVLNDMAEGKVFIGKQAIDVGLVDGVSSMDSLLTKEDLWPGEAKGNYNFIEGETEMTLEELKKDHQELVKAIQDEALFGMVEEAKLSEAKAENDRIVKLVATLLGEEVGGKLQSIVESGMTAEQAKVAGVVLLSSKQEETTKEKLLKKMEEGETPPIEGEEAGEPKTFDEAVTSYMEANSCSRAVAIKAVVKDKPDLHAAYIKQLR